MMYSIKGTIILLFEDTLCIENNGITWEIHISHQSYLLFAQYDIANQSDVCKVYTWLHVSDKGMNLYGFYTLAERSVFLTLLKVDGIGPKAAIKILSHSSPELLIAYIKSHDTQSLSSLPGIGIKKASKILLALENVYISANIDGTTVSSTSTSSKFSHNQVDIINGLVKMGYTRQEVEQVMQNVLKDISFQTEERDEGTLMHTLILSLEKKFKV